MRKTFLLLGVVTGLTALASAAPVRTELRTEVDSRWSKPGDPVSAKLETPLRIGSLMLPKGTTILGHVQQVVKKDGRGHAQIGLVFDRVTLSDGRRMAIAAKIVAAAASPYQRIPDCDSPGLVEESSLQVMTRNCHAPVLYRAVQRSDGGSGTLMKATLERGPERESWLGGPLTLAKGTRIDVEISPAS